MKQIYFCKTQHKMRQWAVWHIVFPTHWSCVNFFFSITHAITKFCFVSYSVQINNCVCFYGCVMFSYSSCVIMILDLCFSRSLLILQQSSSPIICMTLWFKQFCFYTTASNAAWILTNQKKERKSKQDNTPFSQRALPDLLNRNSGGPI